MVDDESKQEMQEIIANLKKKMAEIDKMTDELNKKKKDLEKDSPKKTKKLLEEIKVPSLDLLK